MLTEEIFETVEKLSYKQITRSPGGCASHFVKLNDKIGVKLYRSKRERDACMENQEAASEAGFGPDVYGPIDIEPTPNNEMYLWGYFTECVDIVMDYFYDDGSWNLPKYGPLSLSTGISELDDIHESLDDYEWEKLISPWIDSVNDEIGMYLYDFHMGNIGVKNGNFVIVDFGSEGM